MNMKHRVQRIHRPILFNLSLFMVFLACHSTGDMDSKKSQIERMDNEIWNPVIILTQEEKKIVTAKSKKLYKNNDDSALLIGDVKVYFHDENGNRISTLHADTARINEQTNDLNANGNVHVVSDSGYTLSTNEITWNNSYKMIISKDSVMFTTLEGDTLNGVGFESDMGLDQWRIFRIFGVTREGI